MPALGHLGNQEPLGPGPDIQRLMPTLALNLVSITEYVAGRKCRAHNTLFLAASQNAARGPLCSRMGVKRRSKRTTLDFYSLITYCREYENLGVSPVSE